MSEWINVEEKLPENDRYVIVGDISKNHTCCGYYSQREGWKFLFEDYRFTYFTATHWMNFPKLPVIDSEK